MNYFSFAISSKILMDALKEVSEQPLRFEINKETLEIVTNYIGEGIYIDSRLTNNVLYLIYTQTKLI